MSFRHHLAAAGALAIVSGAAPALAGNDDPDAFAIAMPAVANRSIVIDQIGDGNYSRIEQTATNALARVEQRGDGNRAAVTQQGTATSYATLVQQGSVIGTSLLQDGDGRNVAHAVQTGDGNSLSLRQIASAGVHNGALLSQLGSDNSVLLTQDGSDNRAALSQTGDRNAMTATQLGVGNQLAWTQNGNNLSNLGITQSGGQAMQITQTGGGR